jgi:hypothetical protein
MRSTKHVADGGDCRFATCGTIAVARDLSRKARQTAQGELKDFLSGLCVLCD